MSLTKAMNSKSNVKQKSGADIPFAPRSTVLGYHEEESVDGQTVINLGFSVDQDNTEVFFLFINSGKLKMGATSDFTFTSIDQNNYSSQVTLNSPLIAGLQIEAYKLAAKKDNDVNDNRWLELYDAQLSGFQAFVDETAKLQPTPTIGAPAAGYFHSTVINRASIPDISANLKPHIGIERIICQQVYQIQNEFGPNGETVWGVINDTKGLIRMVGNFTNQNSAHGTASGSSQQNHFVEVTFYGTGISSLNYPLTTADNLQVYIDGNLVLSNLFPTANTYPILQTRNYASNTNFPAAQGLPLGVHTARFVLTTNTGNAPFYYGFDILNESSNVVVNPGITYSQGKKILTSAQALAAYNSGFTNVYGTVGARGGRVLVYQDSLGVIKKDVRYVDVAAAYLGSASHANEEVIRGYHFREFGAGRTDDFSSLNGATLVDRTFTLDDGTTTLVGYQINNPGSPGDIIQIASGGTSFVTFTFVGTGLDVVQIGDGSTRDACPVFVDGSSVGSLSTYTYTRTAKIVSGLPYGTHTVKIQRTASASTPNLAKFIVYGPKKTNIAVCCYRNR
jgi:hypothetical protein